MMFLQMSMMVKDIGERKRNSIEPPDVNKLYQYNMLQ